MILVTKQIFPRWESCLFAWFYKWFESTLYCTQCTVYTVQCALYSTQCDYLSRSLFSLCQLCVSSSNRPIYVRITQILGKRLNSVLFGSLSYSGLNFERLWETMRQHNVCYSSNIFSSMSYIFIYLIFVLSFCRFIVLLLVVIVRAVYCAPIYRYFSNFKWLSFYCQSEFFGSVDDHIFHVKSEISRCCSYSNHGLCAMLCHS